MTGSGPIAACLVLNLYVPVSQREIALDGLLAGHAAHAEDAQFQPRNGEAVNGQGLHLFLAR